MTVYEAISEMRRRTERGECFQFAYMSYSHDRRESKGVISVNRARLRPQNRRETNRYTDYMLSFVDLDTGEYRRCWQPLLMEFEGEPLGWHTDDTDELKIKN
jgi:hypothetical protein